VYLLTNMHKPQLQALIWMIKEMRPNLGVYNRNMGFVDTSDMTAKSYSTYHITWKWIKKTVLPIM
jgi:hypothetical protein